MAVLLRPILLFLFVQSNMFKPITFRTRANEHTEYTVSSGHIA